MKTQSSETGLSLADVISRKYLLDDAALGQLAHVNVDTADLLFNLRQAYLRVLLAGVQVAIGLSSPKQSNTRKYSRLDAEGITAQLKALNDTHAKYYAVISNAVVTPDIADGARLGDAERHRRAIERNRRTNYARTAKAALKGVIATGYDLKELNVMAFTKTQAYSLITQRTISKPADVGASLAARLQTLTTQVYNNVRALTEIDPQKATDLVTETMSQLGALVMDLGMKPVRSLEVGAREHRPIKLKEGLFWSIDPTQLDAPAATM